LKIFNPGFGSKSTENDIKTQKLKIFSRLKIFNLAENVPPRLKINVLIAPVQTHTSSVFRKKMNMGDIINAFFGGSFPDDPNFGKQGQVSRASHARKPVLENRRSAILKSAKIQEEQYKIEQEKQREEQRKRSLNNRRNEYEQKRIAQNNTDRGFPQWEDLEKNVQDPTLGRSGRSNNGNPFDHPFFTGNSGNTGNSGFSSHYTSKSSSFRTLPDGSVEKTVKTCDENGCRTETTVTKK
jgi:hypothetical protein